MKINRIPTKAYLISSEAEKSATQYFKSKAGKLRRQSKGDFSFALECRYAPVLVFSAVKRDKDDPNKIIYCLGNRFHINLNSGSIYVMGGNSRGEAVKGVFFRGAEPQVRKIDLLLPLADLTPKALLTLGYIIDHGTINVLTLDAPTQKAVRELEGRKYVDVYTPEERESILSSLTKEIIEMKRVTPVSYVKPFIQIPKFPAGVYNVSSYLKTTDVLEEDYRKEKVIHSPEKLGLLLGTLFNCSLALDEIVYMPYIKCDFSVGGKRLSEERYIACLKSRGSAFKYASPVKVKAIMLGIKGHGLESVPVEDVAINFSNVAGMDGVKQKLAESIILPLTNTKLAKEYGSKVGGGVLFYGPPGCGKTYIMRATVGEAGVNFYSVGIQDIIGNVPETGAKKLHEAFDEARAGAPSILFFDEIESLGGKRGAGDQSAATRLVVNQLLTEMAGIENSNENVLVVGATNAPWDMDPALRRAGRFTSQVFLPPPDPDARKALFHILTKERPLEDGVDANKLAELTEEYSSADIVAICDDAAKIPWNESLQGKAHRKISMADFTKVLSDRESSIQPWLRLAERQIRESGEADLYPDLSEYLFKRAGGLDMVSKPDMKFSAVGDLQKVKEEIIMSVIEPLVYPDLARKFGREVGGGILFYGPPGCGKTYIARATAGECDASFFNVKLTDIISAEEGVTEKRLHSIFERAVRNTPAIIFFDEIDAIAGARSAKQSSSERRLVNQLLTELDGFEQRQGVVVIAATNSPWILDPALRRPGRFSKQIFLPPPDAEGREEVFKLHAQKLPLNADVDFKKLADMTSDFSPADIKLICDEAAKIPWKESVSGKAVRNVSMKDFEQVITNSTPSLTAWYKMAEKEVKASGETELYPEMSDYILKHAGGVDKVLKPTVNFKDVADLVEAKEAIRKSIIYPLKNPDLARKFGREVGGGILFYGPPGCGKTYIARATAGECDASFFNIKLIDILSSEVGDSEKRLHDIFERAIKNKPSILFFDEIDALAPRREYAGKSRALVNQFLTELDGFAGREGVVVVAATNSPWDVDPALRRPGRFSDQIYLKPPDMGARIILFKLHTQHMPVDPTVDFGKLAGLTEGYSSADVKAVCDAAAEIPWVSALEGKGERPISGDDFIKAVSNRKSSLAPWFVLAEKQINSSGEQEIYAELLEDIRKNKK